MYRTKSLAAAFIASLGCLAFAAPSAGLAQTTDVAFGQNVASVTYGPYLRFELGGANADLSDAYWLPPGAEDPRVNFDPIPNDDWRGLAGAAVGYDWQNGFRADLSVFSTGTTGLTAPCSSVSNQTPCNEHADITDAAIESRGLMGNVFYAPLEARGSTEVLQPFIVAGLGFARNEMSPWTRTKNPENPTFEKGQVRTFEGSESNDMVWSLGAGASLQLTRPGQWPVILETSYRYYDYGSVSGEVDPVDTGSSARQGFTVDHTDHVISVSIRIPLQRY
jgi:opacity protein-like surface antigen